MFTVQHNPENSKVIDAFIFFHVSYKSLINIVIVPLHVLLSDWNLVTSKVILNLIPSRHLNQTLRCFEKTMSFLLVLVLVLDLAFKIMTSLLYIREYPDSVGYPGRGCDYHFYSYLLEPSLKFRTDEQRQQKLRAVQFWTTFF